MKDGKDPRAGPGPADIVIRAAEPRDVDGIFRVRVSVRENRLSMEELAAMGITPGAVARMIAAGDRAWVAETGDRIAGFSMIDPEAGTLFAAFVLPAHEGMGIGRRLVAAAEVRLFASHEIAWLETGRGTRAEGFYARLGWRHWRDPGGGDVRMEKRRGRPIR